MGADVDVVEAHVSIRNYVTRKPYVTSDGQTSLDLPYETLDWSEIMFEAKVNEISTGRLTLPSLIAFPGLRPLYQSIKEGDRIEIFNFQPDCGDPVIAGFIPPNGIEHEDGKVILNFEDTLGQLKWQHVRRFESPITGSASVLYDRARSMWTEVLNEDFLAANTSSFYGTSVDTPNAPTFTWKTGSVQIAGTNSAQRGFIFPNTGPAASFTISPGDTYLLEADVNMNSLFATPWPKYIQFFLELGQVGIQALGSPAFVAAALAFQNSAVVATPYEMWPQIQIESGGVFYGPAANFGGTNLAAPIAMPASHHLALYIQFALTGVTAYFYLDNVNVVVSSVPWVFDSTLYQAQLMGSSPSAAEYVQVTSWRVAKLAPTLLRAARFNPQTADVVSQQVNYEENLQFLQLIAEKDNAEYRPVYHPWPQYDELELDQSGTLGRFASRTLGYEQPPSLPTEGSPQASPLPVIVDVASFLTAPPFRFEEAVNLGAAPRIQPKANAHANDVIRVGASSMDSQLFAEKWLTSELGKPQQGVSATFPRFEQITNDDRVGIQTILVQLDGYELTRRTDGVPSLELQVVDEVPWAFRWRAGDQVFTKTLSLLTNLEQELRVQKVQYRAGSPLRTVTLGHIEQDPSMLRLLSEDTKIAWLYEQSGSNPGIYVYPSTGNIISGATSAAFNIPLDQYTSGAALVKAWLHWFADANVMKLDPIVNGTPVPLAGIPGISGTESGLVDVTGTFQGPGTYTLQFTNNDSVTRSLTGAFLVLRIRGG